MTAENFVNIINPPIDVTWPGPASKSNDILHRSSPQVQIEDMLTASLVSVSEALPEPRPASGDLSNF